MHPSRSGFIQWLGQAPPSMPPCEPAQNGNRQLGFCRGQGGHARSRASAWPLKTRWFEDPSGVSRRYVLGSGVAVADVDGNGWEDVVLVNAERVERCVLKDGDIVAVGDRQLKVSLSPPGG